MDDDTTQLSSLPPAEKVAEITEGAGLRELDPDLLAGAGSGSVSEVGKYDRVLYMAAVFMIPAGLALIILGWYGAANTVFVFEQIPYLVSGGLLGAAFLIGGAVIYVGVWIERVAHQQRRQAEQMAELLALLRGDIQELTSTTAEAAKSNGTGRVRRPAAATAAKKARKKKSATRKSPEAR